MMTPQKSRFYANMPLTRRRAYAVKRLISYMEQHFTDPAYRGNHDVTLCAKRVAKLLSSGYI